MKYSPLKTDNAHLARKEALRRMATADVEHLRVLDLFAGYNTLWRNFPTERYYGVEMVKGKGANLHADNLRVIPSLDLSDFTVIDCDSYGSCIKQIDALYANRTLRPGTVILFTEIHSAMSALPSELVPKGMEKAYASAPTLFNRYGFDLFLDALHRHGVRSYRGYSVHDNAYLKNYGYFVVTDCQDANV